MTTRMTATLTFHRDEPPHEARFAFPCTAPEEGCVALDAFEEALRGLGWEVEL